MFKARWLLTALTAVIITPALAAPQTPPDEEMVWPLAPDLPRIRYAGFLQSERDIGAGQKSFLGRMRTGILGESQTLLTVNRPYDVYVSPSGLIYVSNGTKLGVLMFDPEKKEATVIRGVGPASVAKAMGITGDAAGNIYIADATGRRVIVLNNQSEFVKSIGGPDVLLNPVDVALSPSEDRIYVSDSYLHQVLVFDADGELITRIGRDEGDLAAKQERPTSEPHGSMEANPTEHPVRAPGDESSDLFENRGREEGAFRYPSFLSTSPDGTLYVTDAMNFRIQVFTRDGEFLRQIGALGDRPGSFARPKGNAVDSDGNFYAVDAAFGNVQIFDTEGRLLLTFAEMGNGPGQIWMPLGMAIDGQDRIFIADRFNNRLQVFQYVPQPDVGTVAGPEGS
jgi:DNA-binding beta-propeller fold protein YncE